jgi:TIR domain
MMQGVFLTRSEAVLDDTLIQRIEEELGRLPRVNTGLDRDKSWMSAGQISEWLASCHSVSLTPEEVESELLRWWRKNRDEAGCPLRPAKYPSLTACCRLWGHVGVVDPAPDGLEPARINEPIVLDRIDLHPDKGRLFLSYSMRDLHLAAWLRLVIGKQYGHSVWLADQGVQCGDLIFEGVRWAMNQCVGMVVLVTGHSLGSAWMDTEIETAVGLLSPGPLATPKPKPIIFVADATDPKLMKLLNYWKPGEAKLPDQSPLDPLDPLICEFARIEKNDHRCEKYRYNAMKILGHMGIPLSQLALFPQRPHGWQGDAAFTDVGSALQRAFGYP